MPARLIHMLSSTLWGGREQYALDICRSYSQRGWNVTVFTGDATAIDTPFKQAGIKVRHLPLGRYAGLSTILRLGSLLRQSAKEPTVVHVHTMRDAFLALAARRLSRRKRHIKVVLTYHRVRPCRNNALRRRILRNLHALIFPSALCKGTFLSPWNPMELPLPADRVHTIHNSIYTTEDAHPGPPATGPLVAFYYGRIVQGKGLETFISALPALRGLRTRACIAGQGDPDYIDALKRLADRLGVMDMIDWAGKTLTMAQVLDSGHIGVFPSLLPESFGLSNAACMAWGRPQVCTLNGAQTEYLTHGQEALLITPSDGEGLANALLRLIKDSGLRARMGAAARKRYDTRLAWPRFETRLTGIYTS